MRHVPQARRSRRKLVAIVDHLRNSLSRNSTALNLRKISSRGTLDPREMTTTFSCPVSRLTRRILKLCLSRRETVDGARSPGMSSSNRGFAYDAISVYGLRARDCRQFENAGQRLNGLLRLSINTGEFSPTLVKRAPPSARENRVPIRCGSCGSEHATAIKHCLIAGGISILIATVVNGIGRKLNSRDNSVSPKLQQEREKPRRRGPLPSPPFLSGQPRAPASRPSSLLLWAACR
jgi:hypothetical protein